MKRYILYKWKKEDVPVTESDFNTLDYWQEEYNFDWIQIAGAGLDEGNYMIFDSKENKMIMVFKVA